MPRDLTISKSSSKYAGKRSRIHVSDKAIPSTQVSMFPQDLTRTSLEEFAAAGEVDNCRRVDEIEDPYDELGRYACSKRHGTFGNSILSKASDSTMQYRSLEMEVK